MLDFFWPAAILKPKLLYLNSKPENKTNLRLFLTTLSKDQDYDGLMVNLRFQNSMSQTKPLYYNGYIQFLYTFYGFWMRMPRYSNIPVLLMSIFSIMLTKENIQALWVCLQKKKECLKKIVSHASFLYFIVKSAFILILNLSHVFYLFAFSFIFSIHLPLGPLCKSQQCLFFFSFLSSFFLNQLTWSSHHSTIKAAAIGLPW